ncbi:arylsulfatase [Verrucomicrobiaceae bacterium N1E253]|uniref:Arylsulfatase n=1 Tax=Oceaniferula marina TaxID=2748318 RepID=A0A851GNY6_9BACT|nr:arylsulfatase [Oceaniferula marina]
MLGQQAMAAVLEWTGAGDNISLFQEANWEIQGGGAVAGNPLAPNVVINDPLIFTGIASNVSSQLKLASTLEIKGGELTMTASGGMSGGRVSLSNDGKLSTDWANQMELSLGHGTLTLRGAGSPLTGSVIACQGSQWEIHFTGKSLAAVRNDHLAQITVDGQPAASGVNMSLSDDGSGGAWLRPLVDSDADGLADQWELEHFGNLDAKPDEDPDGDLLDNIGEQQRGTNPNKKDTDGDGLTDQVESGTGVWVGLLDRGTDALNPDSDRDGLLDGVESRTGVWVSGLDTGTDPLMFNSDGDRIGDGAEAARGSNPNDPSSQPDLPNVIFIMADDLGYNHLSVYGQQRLQTPHIDSLASAGIRFNHAYAGCTVCGPSRSSLMTGIHSGHIPYKPNGAHVDITDRTKTVAEVFKQAGYMTGMFGKWGIGGLGSGQTPLDRGFDRFYGMLDQGHGHRHFPSYLIEDNVKSPLGNTVLSGGNTSSNAADRVKHTHDAFTDQALQFIDQHHEQAFFCYLAFTLPHTEIVASDEVLNSPEFDPSLWPETYTANTSVHLSQSQPRRNFGAEIRMIDNSVGAVIAKLEEHNLTDNTLLIFTSDNGGQLKRVWGSAPSDYFNANGHLRGGKEDSYEGGLRVPMLASWPGTIPAGRVSDLPTYFADFLPTVTDILGVEPPRYVDGFSILPTMKGALEKQKKHAYLFWSHQRGSLDHAVRAGKWKAVKRGGNAIELFDLDADPSETSNVASSYPELVAEMQRIMDREYQPDLPETAPSSASPVYPNHP